MSDTRPELISVAVSLLIMANFDAAMASASNRQWSVELSQVTTLAPPGKLAEAKNFINLNESSKQDVKQHHTNMASFESLPNQNDLFDDSPRDSMTIGHNQETFSGKKEADFLTSSNRLSFDHAKAAQPSVFGPLFSDNLDQSWAPKTINHRDQLLSPVLHQHSNENFLAIQPAHKWTADLQYQSGLAGASFQRLADGRVNFLGKQVAESSAPQASFVPREIIERALAIQQLQRAALLNGTFQSRLAPRGELRSPTSWLSSGVPSLKLAPNKNNNNKLQTSANRLFFADEGLKRSSKSRDDQVLLIGSPASTSNHLETAALSERAPLVVPFDYELDRAYLQHELGDSGLGAGDHYQQLLPPYSSNVQARVNQDSAGQELDGRSSKLDIGSSGNYAPNEHPIGLGTKLGSSFQSPSALEGSSLFGNKYVRSSTGMAPIYVATTYPSGHYNHGQHHIKTIAFAKPRHAGHEKGLITPVLVGIGAALISFLIISNLFLSIPLLAMTLFSFFNGNMMMMAMPNGMGNNNNAGPNNQPMGQPNNNSQQQGKRRRRKRRDIDDPDWAQDMGHEGGQLEPHLEARILRAIEQLF